MAIYLLATKPTINQTLPIAECTGKVRGLQLNNTLWDNRMQNRLTIKDIYASGGNLQFRVLNNESGVSSTRASVLKQ